MACKGCGKEKKLKRKKVVKMKRKRITKFYATYNGRLKTLKINPVIGKVIIGKKYEVPKLLAEALRGSRNWEVTQKYSYDFVKED